MAASTSAVDYFAQPKPAYYGVAAAYEKVHVSARFERLAWAGYDHFSAEVWVSNAGLDRISGANLTAQVVDARGTELHCLTRPVDVPADGSACQAVVGWPLDAIDGEVFFPRPGGNLSGR